MNNLQDCCSLKHTVGKGYCKASGIGGQELWVATCFFLLSWHIWIRLKGDKFCSSRFISSIFLVTTSSKFHIKKVIIKMSYSNSLEQVLWDLEKSLIKSHTVLKIPSNQEFLFEEKEISIQKDLHIWEAMYFHYLQLIWERGGESFSSNTGLWNMCCRISWWFMWRAEMTALKFLFLSKVCVERAHI